MADGVACHPPQDDMKTRAWWVLAAAVGISACGGNVVVDGAAAGGAPPTTGSTGGIATSGTTVTSTTTTSSSSTSTGISGGSSGVPCVDTCPTGLATGILPCDGLPFDTYTALVDCACGATGMCANECDGNLCKFHAVSAACMACLPGGCAVEFQACSAH
jgi:hypothetical protein